jgi:hypothetical protein
LRATPTRRRAVRLLQGAARDARLVGMGGRFVQPVTILAALVLSAPAAFLALAASSRPPS